MKRDLFVCLFRDSLHALSCLSGYIYKLDHLEVSLQDVNVFVEAAALAPLGHDGQVVLRHVTHEQKDVDMSRLPASINKEKGNTKMQIYFFCMDFMQLEKKKATSGLPLHF